MWPVYLINLAEQPERLEKSHTQFAEFNIAYERMEAVNGWQLTADEIAEVYDEVANRRWGKYPLVRPQIGLFMSHINAWKRIAAGTAEGAFIFEDDFAADPSLPDVLRLLSEELVESDLVKLFSFKQSKFPLSRRPLGERHEIVVPYRVPNCNIAYGLTKVAAGRLSEKVIPFFRQCDETIKFFWDTNLRVSLVWPPPVRSDAETSQIGAVSTTRRAANRRKGWAQFRQTTRNTSYQLHYQTCLHFYRLQEFWR